MPLRRSRYSGIPRRGALLFYLGKFLELNGLVLLGFGLVWGVLREDMKGELTLLGIGVGVFLAGYLLERKLARRK
jgi:hypothetical protein